MDFTNPWSERVLRSMKIREERSMGIKMPVFLGRYWPIEFEVMHKGHSMLPELQQPISQFFSRRTGENLPSSKA